jgi:hypothetical protein
MRIAAVTILALSIPCLASGLECDEFFDGEDGSLPALFTSTGDPNDEGTFAIQGGALVHSESGTAHYVWWCDAFLPADSIWFEVLGAEWEFAWRINSDSATTGTCIRLSHDDRHGEWAYSLSRVSWWCPDASARPECQLTWHNGTEDWTVVYPTGGPVAGWQLVQITDAFPPSGMISVTVGGEPIFEQSCEANPGGLVGLGCSGGELGVPAFDFVVVSWPDPVEQSTWGSIKALYR